MGEKNMLHVNYDINVYGQRMKCSSVSLTSGFHSIAICHATQLRSHVWSSPVGKQ